MLTALLVTYCLLLLGVVLLKIRSRDFFETLPSIFWAAMMVLPLWLDRAALTANFPESLQVYGVMGVAFALLIGDGWAVRRVQLVGTMPSSAMTLAAHCLFIVFGGLQVLHIAQLGDNINLVAWIRGEGLGFFAKTDSLLWYQALLTIGVPVTLAALIRARAYLLGLCFFLIALFYGFNVSLLLFGIFLFLGVLLFTQEVARIHSRRLWLVMGALVLIPLAVWWLVLDNNNLGPLSAHITQQELEELKSSEQYRENGFAGLTQGDHFRLLQTTPRYKQQISPASHAFNRLLAGLFQAPLEQSAWWYHYFPHVEGELIEPTPPQDLLLGRWELMGPENRVAIWALSRRFQGYPESSFVPASVDADAAARWGVVGLAGAIGFVLLTRWLIRSVRIRSPWGDSLNLIVLVLFAVALPRASMLTVLGKYGVGIGGLLMLTHYLLCRNYLKEDYLPSTRSFDSGFDRF